MSIKAHLTEEMKSAMRARDAARLETLRYALSRIKNVEIDEGELDDAGVEKILAKIVKEIRESIVEYGQGNRADLVEKEEQKLTVMKAFLPEPLSDEELHAIIDQVKQDNPGLSGGQLIGAVLAKAGGRADGGRVAAMLR